jgi:RimJ/RimL family protein N-acetyltransferase
VTAEVVLRSATSEDGPLLLGWANDPATRAASRRPEIISATRHRRWLEQRLATPIDNRIWVGVSDGVPIGVVRFERRAADSVEVSITVAPDARGRGLARPLLEAGVAAAHDAFGTVTIVAEILPGNEASIRLFTATGFTPVPSRADDPGSGRIISLQRR